MWYKVQDCVCLYKQVIEKHFFRYTKVWACVGIFQAAPQHTFLQVHWCVVLWVSVQGNFSQTIKNISETYSILGLLWIPRANLADPLSKASDDTVWYAGEYYEGKSVCFNHCIQDILVMFDGSLIHHNVTLPKGKQWNGNVGCRLGAILRCANLKIPERHAFTCLSAYSTWNLESKVTLHAGSKVRGSGGANSSLFLALSHPSDQFPGRSYLRATIQGYLGIWRLRLKCFQDDYFGYCW